MTSSSRAGLHSSTRDQFNVTPLRLSLIGIKVLTEFPIVIRAFLHSLQSSYFFDFFGHQPPVEQETSSHRFCLNFELLHSPLNNSQGIAYAHTSSSSQEAKVRRRSPFADQGPPWLQYAQHQHQHQHPLNQRFQVITAEQETEAKCNKNKKPI
jgi:hypothetical protein